MAKYPKYDNLSRIFHIFLTASGEGSTQAVSLTAFFPFFFDDSPNLYPFHDESKFSLNFWLLLSTILNNIIGKVEQGQFVPTLCSHKVSIPKNVEQAVKTGTFKSFTRYGQLPCSVSCGA